MVVFVIEHPIPLTLKRFEEVWSSPVYPEAIQVKVACIELLCNTSIFLFHVHIMHIELGLENFSPTFL